MERRRERRRRKRKREGTMILKSSCQSDIIATRKAPVEKETLKFQRRSRKSGFERRRNRSIRSVKGPDDGKNRILEGGGGAVAASHLYS